MLKRFAIAAILVVGGALAGCASVPMADTQRDATAKTFAVTAGKANIYVYRNETMGAAVKLGLHLDVMPVGETSAKTYYLLQVLPGKHTLVSTAENESAIDVVTEAGKNYFVWREVKMGFLMARSKLQQVDDATGKAGVSECSLAQGVR